MAIKISFCIPTLNRGSFIGATLESIISQATESIEIVIVDGGSTDNTSEVVRQYQKNFPRLRYFRPDASDTKAITAKPSNVGFDQDCSRAVELAQGEYCWLFTDDDLLMPCAVNAVLNEISKGYSLIVVNAQVMNRDLSKILENERLKMDTNEIYSKSEMEQLFNRAVSYLSFVGGVVINRNLWLQREKERYFGTGFIHIGVIFQAPLPASAFVIAEPYITIRYGNSQWSQRAFEIWIFRWPNLLYSFAHIPERAKREYQNTESWPRLRKIIIYRAMGAYTLEEYKKWFAAADSSLRWRFATLFIALMPACFVNLFLLSYLKIIKKEALLIECLKNDKNNIMNIMRRKDR
ncbi:MAG: glycosyltransferase family 2 protein [Sedimentisphaerales bacterium]